MWRVLWKKQSINSALGKILFPLQNYLMILRISSLIHWQRFSPTQPSRYFPFLLSVPKLSVRIGPYWSLSFPKQSINNSRKKISLYFVENILLCFPFSRVIRSQWQTMGFSKLFPLNNSTWSPLVFSYKIGL
jgi:hypothetical protein